MVEQRTDGALLYLHMGTSPPEQKNHPLRSRRSKTARASLETWASQWSAADTSHVVLGLVTAFLLLASPLVPYLFTTFGELLLWTLLIGVPLGIVGVVLEHRLARQP
jgi:hypothetical protein